MTPRRSRNDLVIGVRDTNQMQTPERGPERGLERGPGLVTPNRNRTKSPIARVPRFDEFGNAQNQPEGQINARDAARGRAYGRSRSTSPINQRTPGQQRQLSPRPPEFGQN